MDERVPRMQRLLALCPQGSPSQLLISPKPQGRVPRPVFPPIAKSALQNKPSNLIQLTSDSVLHPSPPAILRPFNSVSATSNKDQFKISNPFPKVSGEAPYLVPDPQYGQMNP